MGSRAPVETVARVIVALMRQRTWTQAALAREVGVQPRAVRVVLERLAEAGVPLHREEEHPHVYWSVPRTWVPAGVVLQRDLVAMMARLLARGPKTRERERVLEILLSNGIEPPVRSTAEVRGAEDVLASLEDSIRERAPVTIDYYTAARGDQGTRTVSVHRVLHGDDARFLATCHRSESLKWFRLDRVTRARIEGAEPYRDALEDEIEAFIATSVGGFRAPGPASEHSFSVRAPEARWVARNLPAGLRSEADGGGIRVRARAAAVDVVARFVVGLGGAAHCETDELRDRVAELARAALAATRRPK
jgi:predicted DNA-binding transcriptional regulator YafY